MNRTQRHQLYRYFDASGALLYVGISANAFARLTQHAATQPWWQDVVGMTVEWHPDRPSVLAAEREAIKAEAPIWNKVHAEPVPCHHCISCRSGDYENCPLIAQDMQCDCGRPGCPWPTGFEDGEYDGWRRAHEHLGAW